MPKRGQKPIDESVRDLQARQNRVLLKAVKDAQRAEEIRLQQTQAADSKRERVRLEAQFARERETTTRKIRSLIDENDRALATILGVSTKQVRRDAGRKPRRRRARGGGSGRNALPAVARASTAANDARHAGSQLMLAARRQREQDLQSKSLPNLSAAGGGLAGPGPESAPGEGDARSCHTSQDVQALRELVKREEVATARSEALSTGRATGLVIPRRAPAGGRLAAVPESARIKLPPARRVDLMLEKRRLLGELQGLVREEEALLARSTPAAAGGPLASARSDVSALTTARSAVFGESYRTGPSPRVPAEVPRLRFKGTIRA